MKWLVAFGLLVTITLVVCQDELTAPVAVTKPRPIGVIYLIKLLNQPEIQNDYGEISNTIPTGNPYRPSKLLIALTPNNIQEEKENNREKRSPGYGKGGGGGGCNVCGGGGGGYPSGGGHGGGGYGGGGGSSGSWATASSGSYGSGYGGGGKGKYGK